MLELEKNIFQTHSLLVINAVFASRTSNEHALNHQPVYRESSPPTIKVADGYSVAEVSTRLLARYVE